MNNWISIEERQHINISEKTHEILLYDIEKYHLNSFSALTNLDYPKTAGQRCQPIP